MRWTGDLSPYDSIHDEVVAIVQFMLTSPDLAGELLERLQIICDVIKASPPKKTRRRKR